MFLVPGVILPRLFELTTGGSERILSSPSISSGHSSKPEMISPYSNPFGWLATISRRLDFVSDPSGAKLASSGLATVYERGDTVMSAWYKPIEALFRFLPYVKSSFSCREIQPFNASSEGWKPLAMAVEMKGRIGFTRLSMTTLRPDLPATLISLPRPVPSRYRDGCCP